MKFPAFSTFEWGNWRAEKMKKAYNLPKYFFVLNFLAPEVPWSNIKKAGISNWFFLFLTLFIYNPSISQEMLTQKPWMKETAQTNKEEMSHGTKYGISDLHLLSSIMCCTTKCGATNIIIVWIIQLCSSMHYRLYYTKWDFRLSSLKAIQFQK